MRIWLARMIGRRLKYGLIWRLGELIPGFEEWEARRAQAFLWKVQLWLDPGHGGEGVNR